MEVSSLCLLMSGISNDESVFKFSESLFLHFYLFFFQFYTMWSKKIPSVLQKVLILSLQLFDAHVICVDRSLSIKIHRRNFHVSTDPQWVQIIFGLEYQIFILCFLKFLQSGMYCLH